MTVWPTFQKWSKRNQKACLLEGSMAEAGDQEHTLQSCSSSKPPDSAGDKKKSLPRQSISLGVGESFPTDVNLSYSVRRCSSKISDPEIQELIRRRLRILQGVDKEIVAMFNELSARLISIHTEKDLFVITFKTVEEVWKFSTYLALGYVARCLEHLLFDKVFWLHVPVGEELEIIVHVNQHRLTTIYLGLLLQEGVFCARVLYDLIHDDDSTDDHLELCKDGLVNVRDIGEEMKWEGFSVTTGARGLVPVEAIQPLPNPFHQWFLKNYPGNGSISAVEVCDHVKHPIGTGTCTAVRDYKGDGADELSFCSGEHIKIVGFLILGQPWFVGKSLCSGNTGFVRASHTIPENFKPLESDLMFVSEEERLSLALPQHCTEEYCTEMLKRLAQTDVSTVYRLDKQEVPKALGQTNQSTILQRFKESTLSESWEYNTVKGESELDESSLKETSNCPEDLICGADDLDDPKFFIDLNVEDSDDPEVFDPILTFLNGDVFINDFQNLYDLSFSFLSSTFYGFSEEEDLVQYLQMSREWAKKNKMSWAHRRICFLLGRLCAKSHKFSQARVYFEEAMNVANCGFSDPHFLACLYINLAAIYLKQKMKTKLEAVLEKAATFLLCFPQHTFSTENELEVLYYILRKAVTLKNNYLEARVCFLVVKLFLQLGKHEDALPFAERLQVLLFLFFSHASSNSVDISFILNILYDKKYLPHITLASIGPYRPGCGGRALTALYKVDLVIKNVFKLSGHQPLNEEFIPAEASLCLKQALAFAHRNGNIKMQQNLCIILSKLYQQYGVLDIAIAYMEKAVGLGKSINEEEAFTSSVSLAWLYISNNNTEKASKLLNYLLGSLQETDSPTQCGVVHNLMAVAQKRGGGFLDAAKNYYSALCHARETGNKRNQAVSLANFGKLALSCRALSLAEGYFKQSVHLYSELQDHVTQAEAANALQWLGQVYIMRKKTESAKVCYELALAFATVSENIQGQIQATKSLCHFYRRIVPSYGPCIAYHEHWMALSRQLEDKETEEKLLETLSHFYRALNTDKSLRKALDYTKQCLRILIDLGKKNKVAETWLKAGQIYYQLQEEELVEMYFQAATESAEKSNLGTEFVVRMYEEAGDVFYNGDRKREKAVLFYKDGALPLVRRIGDRYTELRIFNKLTDLQMSLKNLEKALEYATMAVILSSTSGDNLMGLVAYHRLATIYYLLQQHELAENYYLKAVSLGSCLFQCASEATYYIKVYCRLGNITLNELKDPHDAAGYYQLALAAAVEQRNVPAMLAISDILLVIYRDYFENEEMGLYFAQCVESCNKELLVELTSF
ncbi:SH3 domain and tetratricopeptide repeat-containing protein 2 [Protopterus annectens]|uniref:SH3 domain and tetratricopeptide repeat-containing protein 2 n=1 Tax=Protopterus annectens TaxID=7888 RepID=UPI001CFBAFA2|nr:SH3 domain and tetratricopeptide repeat-containing protein 2 [Protopterus annectens]